MAEGKYMTPSNCELKELSALDDQTFNLRLSRKVAKSVLFAFGGKIRMECIPSRWRTWHRPTALSVAGPLWRKEKKSKKDLFTFNFFLATHGNMAIFFSALCFMIGFFICYANAVTELAIEESPFVMLVPVVSQPLESPVFVSHVKDRSGRLYIVEQSGRIRILEDGRLLETPLLDITEHVLYGYECGLLGLAFHPDYRQNGRFFVNYSTKVNCSTVIAEYRRSEDGTKPAHEERIILSVPQPDTNHNGGMMAFGPDGFLYIGMGDGGGIGDPQNRAQNAQDLLGKVLRIDVDTRQPYDVPSDNPFKKDDGRPEVYAIGFRNPWRFSFDRHSGELWLGDVGLKGKEEVNVVRKGGNYGWSTMEGSLCFKPKDRCSRDGLIPPLVEYGHEHGRCSITGGYVYRGSDLPALVGTYLYGDYCSGEIFAIRTMKGGQVSDEPWRLLKTQARISSFGEDEQGEIYIVDHQGVVYRLGPRAKGSPD